METIGIKTGYSHKNIPNVSELCNNDKRKICEKYGYCIIVSSYAVKAFKECCKFKITFEKEKIN